MSFLYLEKGKVRCSEEGFTLPEVRKIWNADKTGKEKTYFNDVITGIYYIYKPRGIFWNRPIEERIEKVNQSYLRNSTWQVIIGRDGVQALVDIYRDLSLTVNERIMEGLKNDFKELSKVMEKTPLMIKFKVSKTIEYQDPDGKIRTVEIDRDIEIANTQRKQEQYESWLTLSKMLKQIEENLKVEETERQREEAEKRMFDTREKFVQPEEEVI